MRDCEKLSNESLSHGPLFSVLLWTVRYLDLLEYEYTIPTKGIEGSNGQLNDVKHLRRQAWIDSEQIRVKCAWCPPIHMISQDVWVNSRCSGGDAVHKSTVWDLHMCGGRQARFWNKIFRPIENARYSYSFFKLFLIFHFSDTCKSYLLSTSNSIAKIPTTNERAIKLINPIFISFSNIARSRYRCFHRQRCEHTHLMRAIHINFESVKQYKSIGKCYKRNEWKETVCLCNCSQYKWTFVLL